MFNIAQASSIINEIIFFYLSSSVCLNLTFFTADPTFCVDSGGDEISDCTGKMKQHVWQKHFFSEKQPKS